MFGSEILDVAIGLIFLYLILSLICSAIAEMIEAYAKIRASELERGIRELLNDDKGTGLVSEIYKHPLVHGLFRGDYNPSWIKKNGWYSSGSNLPSYIPARNFALALINTVLSAAPVTPAGAAGADTVKKSLKPLRDAVNEIQNDQVKRALITLLDDAGDDFDKARENIEKWYDSAMDRVSGWYKRWTQVILLVLGFGVAFAVNADTITIANSLSHDRSLRNSLVAAAQEYARSQPQGSKEPEQRIKENMKEIRKLGLPVGWNTSDPRTIPPFSRDGILAWVIKVVGWSLTALAVTLGAPFWFDLLNKFITVRSTVKPHEKSPEKPSVER